jgi:hypothetical protein
VARNTHFLGGKALVIEKYFKLNVAWEHSQRRRDFKKEELDKMFGRLPLLLFILIFFGKKMITQIEIEKITV